MRVDSLKYIKCLLEQEKERYVKLNGSLKDINTKIVDEVLEDVYKEIKAYDFR